jgi:predicted thioesterase
MALRVMPTVGAEVAIDHLGAIEYGVVRAVDPTTRTVEVATDDGRTVQFALNRATARFTAGGGLTGARLRFAEPG